MGAGAKILLTLGVIFGLLLLLCCGVGGFFFYRIGHAITTDPAAIQQVTAKIVTIDLPPQFKPTMAMDNFSVPGTGVSFTMAIYTEAPASNTIMLASISGKNIEQTPQAQLETQIKTSMGQQSGGAKNMTVNESHQRTITVRGKPVSFTVATGKERATGKAWLQVTGMVPSDGAMIMFVFSGDASQYNEEQVVKIIESIR
jgi:hypothetical protein